MKATRGMQDQRRGQINWDVLHHTGLSLGGLEAIPVGTAAMKELMKGELKIKVKHRYVCL